ncbi:MAG: AAA domain-containing protein [Bacteroidia bacterium]|nr:AAA domain-containing protein [Bacteroidia bacterium]
MNPTAYFEQLLSALQQEQKEEEQFYMQEISKLSFQERKSKGLLWYPTCLQTEDFYQTDGILATFKKTTSEIYPNGFEVGQLATVVHPNVSKETYVGTVTHLSDATITLHFDMHELPQWFYQGKVGIQQYYDEQNYVKMRQAIHKTIQADKNSPLGHIRELILQSTSPLPYLDVSYLIVPDLNLYQQKSMQDALSCQDVHLIHGPPGTGKTTTLIQIILQLAKTEKQILVTAPSNAAVDNIAEKASQKGIKVLRIGHPSRINQNLYQTLLTTQIQAHPDYKIVKDMLKETENIRKKAFAFKRNFGEKEREERQELLKNAKSLKKEVQKLEKHIKRTILDQAQVICTTLIGCYHPDIAHKTYTTAIIDEATQAIEPATWLPITQAKRVILAGDHHQLPPTVKSIKASKMGLQTTLFEKIHTAYPQKSSMLQVQYRMNAQIVQFSNQQFYHNQIQNEPQIAEHTLSNDVLPAYTLSPKPLVFIDTAGCGFEEVFDEQSKSLYNPQEAALLEKVYTLLVQNLKIPISIGVISPYSAQIAYIKTCIPSNKHTEIDTIDAFQGREKDAIFISLVRSNSKQEIGFLSDIRRMNVALTRAKKHLVVIGDSATLSTHSFYANFMEYIHTIDAYQSAWEWL